MDTCLLQVKDDKLSTLGQSSIRAHYLKRIAHDGSGQSPFILIFAGDPFGSCVCVWHTLWPAFGGMFYRQLNEAYNASSGRLSLPTVLKYGGNQPSLLSLSATNNQLPPDVCLPL